MAFTFPLSFGKRYDSTVARWRSQVPTFHLPTVFLLIVRWMVETAYSLFGTIGASIKEGICVSESAQSGKVYDDR